MDSHERAEQRPARPRPFTHRGVDILDRRNSLENQSRRFVEEHVLEAIGDVPIDFAPQPEAPAADPPAKDLCPFERVRCSSSKATRVGKECVSQCRSRLWPLNETKQT